ERSKAHAWKVCMRETVSRVRTPPPPPRRPERTGDVPGQAFDRPLKCRDFQRHRPPPPAPHCPPFLVALCGKSPRGNALGRKIPKRIWINKIAQEQPDAPRQRARPPPGRR